MPKCSKCKHDLLQDAVEIYSEIEAIEARKGKKSNWPGERFRHDFKAKSSAKIYGLKDGSLLVVGTKRLWKNFNYSKADVEAGLREY